MRFFVDMEDGTKELVAEVNFDTSSRSNFRLHHWGNIWLVAILNDDTPLTSEDTTHTLTMGELRGLDASTTTSLKSGGELRRARTFANRKGVCKDARPFSKGGE